MDIEYPHEAYWLVAQLAEETRMARDVSLEQAWSPDFQDWQFDDFDVEVQGPNAESAAKITSLVDDLNSVLQSVQVDPEMAERLAGSEWSIAREFKALRPRDIHRGHLVPVVSIPVQARLSIQLLAFIAIDGDRDHLVRENHGFGMHYHYVLADRRRTTTLICWDTNWVSPDTSDQQGIRDRPLFHQLHNDSSKGVRAAPLLWGDKKRRSVRSACAPDLRRQKITDFLPAGSDAIAVWPRVKAVTPKVASRAQHPHSSAMPVTSRHGKGRSR